MEDGQIISYFIWISNSGIPFHHYYVLYPLIQLERERKKKIINKSHREILYSVPAHVSFLLYVSKVLKKCDRYFSNLLSVQYKCEYTCISLKIVGRITVQYGSIKSRHYRWCCQPNDFVSSIRYGRTIQHDFHTKFVLRKGASRTLIKSLHI